MRTSIWRRPARPGMSMEPSNCGFPGAEEGHAFERGLADDRLLHAGYVCLFRRAGLLDGGLQHGVIAHPGQGCGEVHTTSM